MGPEIVVRRHFDGTVQPGDRDTDVSNPENLSEWPLAWKIAFGYNLFRDPAKPTIAATVQEVSAGMDANFKSHDRAGKIFSEPFLEAMIKHAKKETRNLSPRISMKEHEEMVAKRTGGLEMSAWDSWARSWLNRHAAEFDKRMQGFKYDPQELRLPLSCD